MAVRKIRNTWYADLTHEGVRYRKKSPENSRAGAQAYELVLRSRLAHGEGILGQKPETQSSPLFAEFAKEWFDTYVKANNKYSEQETKKGILRAHLVPYFGQSALSEITARKIEEFKTQKMGTGISAQRINNILNTLRKCLRTAVEWEVIAIMPRIRMLKVQLTRIDFLSEDEMRQLLCDRIEPEWNLAVLLALRTGMRIGELLALKWIDIDLSQRTIIVQRNVWKGVISTPKGNQIRHIPMTSDVYTKLITFKRSSSRGFIFYRDRDPSKPATYHEAIDSLHAICRRSEVRKIGWHTLRHSFASHLVMKGVSIYKVMKLLGHQSIEMTMRYAHLAPEALNDAISVLEAPHATSNIILGNRWATWSPMENRRQQDNPSLAPFIQPREGRV